MEKEKRKSALPLKCLVLAWLGLPALAVLSGLSGGKEGRRKGGKEEGIREFERDGGSRIGRVEVVDI